MKINIQDKRNELIWALSMQMVGNDRQYNNQEIANIFNVDRSTILRVIKQKPKDYKVKWFKK